MVPVSHKKISLDQEAANGMISLLQQGGAVLVCFMAMLALTGGAPSGLVVGLTAGLSGIFVTWTEQHRLTKKNLDSSKNEVQSWLEQLKSEGISPNKLAILRRESAELFPGIDAIEELQQLKLILAIVKSKDKFFTFTEFNLKAVNLRGANLRGVNLRGINLSNADLSEADLSGADLSKAILLGADLSKVNLSDANLSHANLSHANLSDANLHKANLTRTMLAQRTDIHKANLSNANLSSADLSDAILADANLSGTILVNTNLRRANLCGANLSGADLSGANVEYTQFLHSNKGITSELKCDLKKRGAIFEDRDRVLSPH
jgi:uncharacterized protein YjbI with pentapeptide repeats